MIISNRHQFIFVKTRKTAGTSVQEALASICGDDDIVTRTGIENATYRPRNFRGPVNPLTYILRTPRRHRISRILRRTLTAERIFDHMYLYELMALPEAQAWRHYYKFCIERNPWDKMVSRYFWKYRDRSSRPDFESFIRSYRDVSDYDLYSLHGRVAVDYIGRYEDLPGSLSVIGKAIGCDIPMPGFQNAGTRKARDYRTMYTPASRDVVARMFAREIEALGYRFD